MDRKFVITIARGYSGGKSLRCYGKLRIPFYDNCFCLASDDSSFHEQLFAKADENLRKAYYSELLKSL